MNMSRFNDFEKNYNDAVAHINCSLVLEDTASQDEKEYHHLVNWLFNTKT